MSEQMSLWVVVICDLTDPPRRRQVRETLRFAGTEVRPGVYEIVARRSRLNRILEQLTVHLDQDDHLRVYRICADCRKATLLFGEGELAGPPCVLII